MGRGRAKAKQTKVARELKYRAIDTDFNSLERELSGGSGAVDKPAPIPDAYADLVEEYEQTSSSHDEGYEDLRKSG